MSELNLDLLKEKFRKKSSVGLEDVDLAMKAVPFLIRVIDDLEVGLIKSRAKIENLQNRLNINPVMSLQGSKWKSNWSVQYEDNHNVLLIHLKGKFNYKTARKAANDILAVSGNIQDRFSVITDMYDVDPNISMKTFFHFKKASFNMKSHGLDRVVRIINPDHTYLMKLFSSKSVFSSSKTYLARDVDEARKILQEENKHLQA